MTDAQKITEQEARFFMAVLRHQKNKPEIDWDAVAADAGYSNGNTTQTRFGQIKRKLNMAAGDTPTKDTPAKGPKGGVSKASSSKSAGKGAGKGARKGKGKGKAAKLLDEEAERDDDEPDDSKIPINYEGVKIEDDVEEKPSVTVKNE